MQAEITIIRVVHASMPQLAHIHEKKKKEHTQKKKIHAAVLSSCAFQSCPSLLSFLVLSPEHFAVLSFILVFPGSES